MFAKLISPRGYIISLLGFCAFLDATTALHARPSCDRKCRDKNAFKVCVAGDCYQFGTATCLYCNPAGTNLCSDGGYVTGYDNCRSDPDPLKKNLLYRFTSCTEVCTCDGTAASVEATMSGTHPDPESCILANCQPSPAP